MFVNPRYARKTGFLLMVMMIGFLVGSFEPLMAQPVSVEARIDKSPVLLGEPFWLTLEIKTTGDAKPDFFKIDSIPHFEMLTKDSLLFFSQGDTNVVQQLYQLTSFDSGRWVIPQYVLNPSLRTNSLLVDVVYTEGFDPQQPYHGVKEVIQVSYKISALVERLWYWIAGVVIIFIIALFWMFRDKKIKPEKGIVNPENAYKKALNSLADLRNSRSAPKQYCTQLVDVFRLYILERTGVSSMQQTSTHLIEKVKPFMKEENEYRSLSEVLHLCDWVKFAKYSPGDNEMAGALDAMEKSIRCIEAGLKR